MRLWDTSALLSLLVQQAATQELKGLLAADDSLDAVIRQKLSGLHPRAAAGVHGSVGMHLPLAGDGVYDHKIRGSSKSGI